MKLYRVIFEAIIMLLGGAMLAIVTVQPPRWQGWMAIGAALMLVAFLGYLHASRRRRV